MKLSEAMMLGDAMMPRNDGTSWFGHKDPDFNECGCAIGRAWFAAGHSFDEWWKAQDFCSEWPWLKNGYPGNISVKFDTVLTGGMTFEQLVDYVRSIEPDCGKCNQFECTCQKEAPILSPVCEGLGANLGCTMSARCCEQLEKFPS